MSFGEHIVNIGDVVEKESCGCALMEMESSYRWESLGRRSDQPLPWARWRTSGDLIEIGGMNTSGGDKILMVIGEMNYLSKVGVTWRGVKVAQDTWSESLVTTNGYWERGPFRRCAQLKILMGGDFIPHHKNENQRLFRQSITPPIWLEGKTLNLAS